MLYAGEIHNRGYIGNYAAITPGTNRYGVVNISVTGAIVRNYGTIENTNSATNVSTIYKESGDLFCYPGSELRVSNGLSPIFCSVNTSPEKDVYIKGVSTNCDGSTYGVGQAFTGGYAPNNLVTSPTPLIFENTAY